jgi:glycosyltransferase involved in cell wall biosynthesis
LPLIELPEVKGITLVADRVPPPLPKVTAAVPPDRLVRIAGRAGAKLLLCLWIALRERPDWVLGFNFVPHGFNAMLVARMTGSRSLYHMIGGEREWLEGGWRSDNNVLGRLRGPAPLLERFLLASIRRCTVVATMGERGRRLLVERGLSPRRVVVIPPAVDLARFASSTREEPSYDIVNVAALIPRKRTSDLLEAVARMRSSGRFLRVAIAGEGPLEDQLRRRATALGLDGSIDFLRFQEAVETLYRRSRIFVLPSADEGLPIAMLEAMASGLPPVVSGVGEVSGFISDGNTGLVFPSGDIAALVERLELLLGDDARRAAIGAAAAADARRRVSVEAVASIYRGFLQP